MTQLTIRRLDPRIIEGLKKRAAAAGRSMEEEARQILGDAVGDDQLARQRAGVKKLQSLRREIFGDRIQSDSTELIRRMRDERTEYLAKLASPISKRKP